MKTLNINIDISDDIKFISSKLYGDIKYLKNKNVFVTGATGFFGIWMLSIFHELNENYGCGINVTALSRDPENFLKNHPLFVGKVQFIKSDIRNFSIGSLKFDYCFHMATTNASETFNNESQINKIDLLYEGTKNLMKQMVKADIKKIIFTSSGVTYGSLPSQDEYVESSVKAPFTNDISSALGEGKRLAEYVITYYCDKHNISFNIARCFSFVGPYLPLNIHYAIGNFIHDALNEKVITVKGTGNDIRSYLYIADAMIWLFKMLFSSKNNEIYNVGSGKKLSIKELAIIIRDLISPKKEIIFLNQINKNDNFERSIYVPNNKKIINNLRVDEWHGIEESIKKTAQIK
jgi:UDP-glucuronate decarboxylase